MKKYLENQYVYFLLSSKYLNLVEAALGELIKFENTNFVYSKNPISDLEISNKTKWSDYNIVEPLLYNFYHGVELLLKGFLKSIQMDFKKEGHGLMSLFSNFEREYPSQTIIIVILKKYINTNSNLAETLKVFFTKNNTDVARYFEVLRYPENMNATELFSTRDLRYLDKTGVPFFSELHSDVKVLNREMAQYWNSISE